MVYRINFSHDIYKLFDGKEIVIVVETHFGIRRKCPVNYILVARLKPRDSKKPCGGVASFKNTDSTLRLKIITNDLHDMLVLEVGDTAAVIVAVYCCCVYL